MTYIYTTDYSALKKMALEILTHATTWMNLEDIMLSEIRESQKDKYCVILLILSRTGPTVLQTPIQVLLLLTNPKIGRAHV